jgi:hypothetical protein
MPGIFLLFLLPSSCYWPENSVACETQVALFIIEEPMSKLRTAHKNWQREFVIEVLEPYVPVRSSVNVLP